MPGSSSAPAAPPGWAGLGCPSLPLPGNRSGSGKAPPVLLSILGYRLPPPPLLGAAPFGALGSLPCRPVGALCPCTAQGLSLQRPGGKPSPLLFPSRLTFKFLPQVSLSPSRQDFATSAAVPLAFICLFFKPCALLIFSPSVVSHSSQSARTGRTLGRAAPFRCCLAWKAKDGLEIRQRF